MEMIPIETNTKQQIMRIKAHLKHLDSRNNRTQVVAVLRRQIMDRRSRQLTKMLPPREENINENSKNPKIIIKNKKRLIIIMENPSSNVAIEYYQRIQILEGK